MKLSRIKQKAKTTLSSYWNYSKHIDHLVDMIYPYCEFDIDVVYQESDACLCVLNVETSDLVPIDKVIESLGRDGILSEENFTNII